MRHNHGTLAIILMVERDSLMIRVINERFDKLEAKLAWNHPDSFRDRARTA